MSGITRGGAIDGGAMSGGVVSSDFFDRLEAELMQVTREGSHLERSGRRDRRHLLALLRHGCSAVALSVVLSASLISGFPASANGTAVVAQAAPTPIVQSL